MIRKGPSPREDSVILLYGLLAQFAAVPADLPELIAPFKLPNYIKHGSAGFLSLLQILYGNWRKLSILLSGLIAVNIIPSLNGSLSCMTLIDRTFC